MSMIRLAVVAAVCVVGSLSAFAAGKQQNKLELPPAETGEIGGQPAILMWPVLDGDGPPDQRLVDPAGCEAHLIPDTDLDRELVYPCGQWFVPPVGKYTTWLESPQWISTTAGVFHFFGGAFKGFGSRALVPVVPAGVVRMKSSVPLVPGATVRFISLDGKGYPLERRTTPAKAAAGIRMPVRRAIAGVFGPGGEALALTRPIDVTQRGALEVTAEAPRGGSGVLAILGRPADDKGYSKATPPLELQDERGAHAPDVVLYGPSRIYAVWYAARGTAATLRLRSKELRLDRNQLVLRPGRITTLRTELGFTDQSAAQRH